jgi:hypothetical protein
MGSTPPAFRYSPSVFPAVGICRLGYSDQRQTGVTGGSTALEALRFEATASNKRACRGHKGLSPLS